MANLGKLICELLSVSAHLQELLPPDLQELLPPPICMFSSNLNAP